MLKPHLNLNRGIIAIFHIKCGVKINMSGHTRKIISIIIKPWFLIYNVSNIVHMHFGEALSVCGTLLDS